MSSYIGQSPVFGDFPSQIITGDGTATYELNFRVSNENGMLVFLNGAVQRPGVDYTAGGTSLAFADVIETGVQILAIGMGLPKSMLSTSAGAIGLAELAAGVYANDVDAQELVDNTKLITPKTLDDAFKGLNQSVAATGFQRFPGGMMIVMGAVTVPTGVYTQNAIFIRAFFDNNYRIITSHGTAVGMVPVATGAGTQYSASCDLVANLASPDTNRQISYIAIGRWK